jgi:excisionase family DNA binding protein
MPSRKQQDGRAVLEDQFMKLREVAEYLRLNERTIYKWAQEGAIPASKLGSTWRFRKSDIDGWIEEHKNKRHEPPAVTRLR